MSILEKVKKVRAGLMDVSKSNRFVNYKARDKMGIAFKVNDIQSFYNDLVVSNKKLDITDMLSDSKDITTLKLTAKQGEALMEEVGYNTLFLSLASLKWTNTEGEENFSPLVFIPINVLFSKEKPHLEYILEDVFINQSLVQALNNELENEVPIEVEEIADESEFNFELFVENAKLYFEDNSLKYKLDTNSCIIDVFNNDSFILYNDLKTENWGNEYFESHHLLANVFERGFSEKINNSIETTSIDSNEDMRQVKNVMSADSSQSRAVYHTLDGKNLLIEGPPGTGKSQTITNIIANNMRVGKTILFVSEKKAALDVVKRRLESVGLGELCLELHSQKVNRETVLKNIETTYKANGVKSERDKLLEDKMFADKQLINEYYDQITLVDDLSNTSIAKAIEEYLLYDQICDGLPPIGVKADAVVAHKQYNETYSFLKDLQDFVNDFGQPSKSKYYGIGIKSLPKDKSKELEKTIKAISKNLASANNVKYDEFDIKQVKLSNLSEIEECFKIMESYPNKQYNITQSTIKAFPEIVKLMQQGMKDLKAFNSEHFSKNIYGFNAKDHGTATSFLFALDKSKSMQVNTKSLFSDIDVFLDTFYEKAHFKSANDKTKKLKTLIKYNEYFANFNTISKHLKSLGFNPSDEIFSFNFQEVISSVDTIEKVSKILYKLNLKGVDEFVNGISSKCDSHKHLLTLVESSKDIINDVKTFDKLLQFKNPHDTNNIEYLIDAFNYFDNHIEDLHRLFRFNEYKTLIDKKGLSSLVKVIEEHDMTGKKILECYLRDRNEAVVNYLIKKNDYFKKFTTIEFNSNIREFIENYHIMTEYSHREEILENYIQKVHDLKYKSYGNLTQETQLSYLRNEFSKKRPKKLRTLLSNTYLPLQVIKPVFLMSPLSVAKFLEPKVFNFDMVVYDEASQLKPDDVLGTVLRSKQLVVVGDSQQLPPTSFFNSVINNDGSGDEFDLNEYESLIKLLKGKGINTVSLDWHYRSEHETLIKFSNDYFYGDKLKYFSSSVQDSPDYGLKYNYVEGEYEKGGSRANILEAMELVNKMTADIERNPNVSIGIVALSLAQCAAIQEEIDTQLKNNKTLRNYIAARAKTGEDLFVKNLEAVQGDERDVIYISIAYGVLEDGKLSKNFGAINRKGGERRLNVLITRARKRTEIFTNMHSADIQVDETTSEGVKVLRSILQYAEFGGEENDLIQQDDFIPQNYIGEALEAKGYRVDYNVGRHDFFIDLAVRSKKDPTKYLIGIEFDQSIGKMIDNITDRDYTRPNVLRAKGWNMYRVYSLDAYENPDSVLTEILNIIKKGEKRTEYKLDIPTVKRYDTSTYSVEDGEFTLYESYDDKPPKVKDGDFDTISNLLLEIIKVEAPIDNLLLNQRVQQLGVFNSFTEITKQDIFTCLYNLEKENKVIYEEGFYYIDKSNIVYRDRRKSKNNASSLVHIAPSELREGVLDIVENAFGITFEGILSLLNKFSNTTKTDVKERSVVEKVVNQLVMDKKILIDKDSFYIPLSSQLKYQENNAN